MNYNFNTLISRENTNSKKYEYCKDKFGTKDIIPLWLADMDFPVPLEVSNALIKRATHPIYGYTSTPKSYFEAIKDWQKKRNNFDVDTQLMSISTSVITAIGILIQTNSNIGDKILIQTPVYPRFHSVVEKNNRTLLTSSLINSDTGFTVDFKDIEEKLKTGVKIFILCNPHNPIGRVWTKNELTKLGELCLKYNTLIISDEAHADFTLFGNKHIPISTLSSEIENITITCISTSKTFNLAGLQCSTTIFPNINFKNRFDEYSEGLKLGSLNCFSCVANETAYKYGESWLEQLLNYIEGNITYVYNYIEKNIPKIKVHKPEATYLMWLDFNNFNLPEEQINELLIKEAKIGLDSSKPYDKNAKNFFRMNVACSRKVLEEAMINLNKTFKNL